MSELRPSLSARCLKWLSDAIYKHRRTFLYPQILLTIVCLWYTYRNLEFNTSRDSLVAPAGWNRFGVAIKSMTPLP